MNKIEVGLEDLVDNVNPLLGKELVFIGARNRRAAWVSGNCLIKANQVLECLTEFELENILKFPTGANENARMKWRRFNSKLNRHLGEVQEVPDFDKMVENTLSIMPSYDDLGEWENWNKLLSHLSSSEIKKLLIQAGEEFLGPIQPTYKKQQNIEGFPDIHQSITYIPPSEDEISYMSKVKEYSLAGFTIRDIARKISISESTVKRIRKKLRIRKQRR
jgi:hypothetical protein